MRVHNYVHMYIVMCEQHIRFMHSCIQVHVQHLGLRAVCNLGSCGSQYIYMYICIYLAHIKAFAGLQEA